jgi:hypothetical protein
MHRISQRRNARRGIETFSISARERTKRGMGQASKAKERERERDGKWNFRAEKNQLTRSTVPVPSWTTSLYSLVEDG